MSMKQRPGTGWPEEQRRLIVELHDVAPPFEAEIRAQLDALAATGIDRYVLNVVPNWHGVHPLTDSPTLVDQGWRPGIYEEIMPAARAA